MGQKCCGGLIHVANWVVIFFIRAPPSRCPPQRDKSSGLTPPKAGRLFLPGQTSPIPEQQLSALPTGQRDINLNTI